jgi:hypothetical protein
MRGPTPFAAKAEARMPSEKTDICRAENPQKKVLK